MSKTDSMPLVGVGMPVFNGAAYVSEAIDSILGQTLENFELVICDNSSTDRTPEICRDYMAQDSRIRYVRQSSNVGAHPNFNRAFRECRGKYFKWAAHDDVLKPTFLERCVAQLEADPAAVLCQSYLDYIDENGEHIGIYDSGLVETRSDDSVKRFASVILRPHPCYEMMGVIRRDVLEKTALLGSFHGADRTLLAELALRGRYCQVPEPMFCVREHIQRYSRKVTKPQERAAFHDTALPKRRVFSPTWRIYSEYWSIVRREALPAAAQARAIGALAAWWFRNYNAARVAVDLLAVPFPGIVGRAEQFKQRVISPAPGAPSARQRIR